MKAFEFGRLLAACSAAIALSGCMTMARGTTESVRVESVPSGAAARIEKAGALLDECSATPCSFVLKRKSPPYVVTMERDGCATATATLDRDHDTSKSLAGNILGLGGLVGLGVDRVSGAGYSVVPNPLIVHLDCR